MNIRSIVVSLLLSGATLTAYADTHAVIETNMGNIELTLYEQKAPKTVANFVHYAKTGFYNQTIFHRVIKGFMIQGGGFTQDMIQKPTSDSIPNESDNGLKNTVGTIAMARTNDPHSATSQFFINVADNPALDFQADSTKGYGYTVFGKVDKGMDVVNRIAEVRTQNRILHQNIPVQPIIIKSVKITSK